MSLAAAADDGYNRSQVVLVVVLVLSYISPGEAWLDFILLCIIPHEQCVWVL